MANHFSEKPRVLVVDDEETIRHVLRDILFGLGCEVVTAAGGEEALRLFGEHRFSLTLTDRQMPGMGGEELAERIRQTHPEHPVIMVSGMSGPVKGAPTVAYLPKPFSRASVTEAVQSALLSALLSALPEAALRG
jgi:two-component system cell cycle sensor histidine kinase/response regulator CckA